MTIKKRLATATSNLPVMIADNYVYVDKTEIIHTLFTTGPQYCLLTRPRRFGKSLLISTMNEIFSGNKELFKGLWISQKDHYDWQTYPIIRIDLSSIRSNIVNNLEAGLIDSLETTAANYGIDISQKNGLDLKLKALVVALTKQTQQRVIILIDEYDHPLTNNSQDTILVEHNTQVLRPFYTILKSLGEYIKFFFITGVSKFPQESIFSGLNNVKDISLLPEYATIAGYTEQEICANFMPYIADIAQARTITVDAVLDDMRTWYNGYHFSNTSVSVYNPFSITNYLSDKEFKNHWFLSGTPSFLLDYLKARKFTEKDLTQALKDGSSLTAFNPQSISLSTLLYQTGYLTIKPNPDFIAVYDLQYPNYEVQMSMYQNLLAVFTSHEQERIITISEQLKKAVIQKDADALCSALSTLLANIPYNLQMKKEAYYHSIFHTTGFLLGLDTHSEVHTSNGRIDLTIEHDDTVIVIELKCKKSAQNALNQIHERRYYEKYLLQNKTIFLVGFAVNFPEKKLTASWIIEELN